MDKISKKMFISAISSLTAIGLFIGALNISNYAYEKDNQNYIYNNVVDQITIWGGDERYVHQEPTAPYLKSNLVSHFENDGQPIRFYISKEIPENYKQQINYVINYYNKIFSIINPDYKFEITNNEINCDVNVRYNSSLYKNTLAQIKINRDIFINSKITSAKIEINKNITPTQLRFSFAHELMHLMYGSNDVDYKLSKTFSLYNYDDASFMINMVDNAKIVTNQSQLNKVGYLTSQQKNSFITLTPTDIGTLIAIYGDTSNLDNVEKYANLLNKTIEICKNFYGNQPFFKDGYKPPTLDCVK